MRFKNCQWKFWKAHSVSINSRRISAGSSAGIGKALVLLLAKEGARLLVHGRRPDRVSVVADEVEKLSGHRPAAVFGNIQDPQVRAEIVEATLKRFGTIDGLVNGAGWATSGGWENEDLDAMQYMLDVHVLAPYDLCRKTLRYIIENKGSIVMVSSIAAMRAVRIIEPIESVYYSYSVEFII